MTKDTTFSLLKKLEENKKVDVKVTNKKYAITFQQQHSASSLALDPSLLSVNGQNEIRVMVNVEEDNIEELVQQVKTVFSDYMKEMAKSDFSIKSFTEVICQFEDYEDCKEMVLDVSVQKDKLLLMKEEEVEELLYTSMNDIYIEKRSVLQDKQGSQSERKYCLQFENWVIIECDDAIVAMHCLAIEDFFMALSKAYFMA